MLNVIVLIGRVATDPELKYTPSGVAVTSFRIAVNRRFKSQETGERETDFIDVVAWRQNAEFATNYLAKGRLIAVQGSLQIRSWVAQDGTRHSRAEVVVDQLRCLDKPKERAAEQEGAFVEPAVSGVDAAPQIGSEVEEDFDPFAEE